MRVIEATRFGGPEVLEPRQREDPVARAGEVVVEVELAEILFLDTQLRAGWGQGFFDIAPPFVPGVGVAGTVRSAHDEADAAWVGRRVIASTSRSGEHKGGGYAQLAVTPTECVFEVPEGMEFSDAIAALHDGMMGVSRVELAQIKDGDRVLVTAAGGSVGAWLVPLAHVAGARVIAAARGNRKLELARERGAAEVVDYSEPSWERRARDAAGGDGVVEVVFDGAGGEIGRAALGITRSGGRFFSYGAAGGEFPSLDDATRRDISVVGIHDHVDSDQWRRYTEQALEEIATGGLRPVIGQTIQLEEAAAAHAAIEDRSVLGKSLLQVR